MKNVNSWCGLSWPNPAFRDFHVWCWGPEPAHVGLPLCFRSPAQRWSIAPTRVSHGDDRSHRFWIRNPFFIIKVNDIWISQSDIFLNFIIFKMIRYGGNPQMTLFSLNVPASAMKFLCFFDLPFFVTKGSEEEVNSWPWMYDWSYFFNSWVSLGVWLAVVIVFLQSASDL